jgi:predicted secreted protein
MTESAMPDGPDGDSNHILVSGSDDFEIRLKAIPSSGYVWHVQKYSEALEPLGDMYEQPRETRVVGSAVTQVFRFHANAKGQHCVRFELKRAWESLPLDAQEFTVAVE